LLTPWATVLTVPESCTCSWGQVSTAEVDSVTWTLYVLTAAAASAGQTAQATTQRPRLIEPSFTRLTTPHLPFGSPSLRPSRSVVHLPLRRELVSVDVDELADSRSWLVEGRHGGRGCHRAAPCWSAWRPRSMQRGLVGLGARLVGVAEGDAPRDV